MGKDLEILFRAAGKEAQYDYQAKKMLGHRSILAQILIHTVDEFEGMEAKQVERLIEGSLHIGTVPVDGGLTNKVERQQGVQIIGLNTENSEINEGVIYFDTFFHVQTKDGMSRIIVDVEAQKNEPTKYELVNRSTYYVSRIISSQKKREFVNSDYDSIKRGFSIWICMNQSQCILNYLHITDEQIVGEHHWKGKQNLINIILIGLPEKVPEATAGYPLHRFLGTIFSTKLSVKEKMKILEDEYQITTEGELEEATAEMCNLGEGILEKGIEIGTERTKKEIVNKMKEMNISIDIITKLQEKSVEEMVAYLVGSIKENGI